MDSLLNNCLREREMRAPKEDVLRASPKYRKLGKNKMSKTKPYFDCNNLCPYDWRNNWQAPWQIACGGTEIPCQVLGKWYIMVLNTKEQKYYYYCFNEDIFKTEEEFEKIKNSQ